MSPRPRKVKIGFTTWDIGWSKRAVRDLLEKDETAGGACAIDSLRIAVEPLPKAKDVERSVLLHEILHACFGVAGTPVSVKVEELVVATITGPLLDALRANPGLVAYLVDTES